MSDFTKIFGTRVFNDTVMRKRLPSDVYKSLRKTIDEGEQLDPSIAGVVASTMKHWNIERAQHFYALVPADDRHNRGKTRQLYKQHAGRHGYNGIFR